MLGSIFLYCGGEVANELLGDGSVGGADANAAEECCERVAPTRTSLQRGTLSDGQLGEPVDVSGYSSLLLYYPETCGSKPFRFTHEANDSEVLQIEIVRSAAQPVPVLGNFVQLVGTSCPGAYRLVGVL